MKTRAAASTFALILGLYAMAPATAESFESFNERGPDIRDRPAASQTPMARPGGPSRATTSHGQRFNKGSALVVAPASSARPAPNPQICDLSPRTGFNESSQIGAC